MTSRECLLALNPEVRLPGCNTVCQHLESAVPHHRLSSFSSIICWGLLFVGSLLPENFTYAQKPSADVRWKKHSINDQSPYEACGAADFNGDGKVDIFSGDSWYEAPSWTKHKVREVPAAAANPHYYEDFADSPLDVNGDGRPDIVTCNYFGKRVGWVENPGGDATQPWIEHEIDLPGSMETGELVDINGDGRLDFLPNTGNVVVWYELTQQKPTVVWTKHDLGSDGAGHGVGVGDINSDGRLDIITPKGWREQPATASDAWPFHGEFELGAAGIFIHGRDVDGDKLTDVIWGMGHSFGLMWLKQSTGTDGQRVWTRHSIDDTFSQVHTLLFANLDGAGEPELITGSVSTPTKSSPVIPIQLSCSTTSLIAPLRSGSSTKSSTETLPSMLPRTPRTAGPERLPQGSAGTGLQMAAIDIDKDGDIDLVCPGKSGLYLFENLGR